MLGSGTNRKGPITDEFWNGGASCGILGHPSLIRSVRLTILSEVLWHPRVEGDVPDLHFVVTSDWKLSLDSSIK